MKSTILLLLSLSFPRRLLSIVFDHIVVVQSNVTRLTHYSIHVKSSTLLSFWIISLSPIAPQPFAPSSPSKFFEAHEDQEDKIITEHWPGWR